MDPEPRRVATAAPRRDFLKTSALLAGGALAGPLLGRAVHAAGSDVLKIGLIGCGGRGAGAALNALNADKNTKLVAMADVFADRLHESLALLRKQNAAQVAVSPERCFVGFDAYEKLIASDVDVVLLAEVPHYRPRHLRAAIEAGKHVFCEKPVAVDAPGVRSVLESSELAARKGLCLVSGLCWRYHAGVRATMARVLDGAIGAIHTIRETYLTNTLWQRPRQPDWTEMQYQMRNWLYFAWLSGDFITEQHIHSLDKANWAMRGQTPLSAWGMGGRQVRTDAKFGDIYDHHAIVYEYPRTTVYAFCRQQAGCFNDTNDLLVGTKGRASVLRHRIEGEKPWRYSGPPSDMYQAEHDALFAAIRSGKPINNGQYMAQSTMLAILGRMVSYSGQTISWDEAIGSKQSLAPQHYDWNAAPPVLPDREGRYPIAMPGVTRFA